MNKEFIPYEQALELKELGFDEECFKWYVNSKLLSDDHIFFTCKDDLIAFAPLYQQAFRWFREKHHLASYIEAVELAYEKGYLYNFEIPKADGYDSSYVDTYEEAELACLKKLIEITKNK